jgi:hypothetical protein
MSWKNPMFTTCELSTSPQRSLPARSFSIRMTVTSGWVVSRTWSTMMSCLLALSGPSHLRHSLWHPQCSFSLLSLVRWDPEDVPHASDYCNILVEDNLDDGVGVTLVTSDIVLEDCFHSIRVVTNSTISLSPTTRYYPDSRCSISRATIELLILAR